MIKVGPAVHAYNRVGTKIFVRLLSFMLASASMAMAETPDPAGSPDSATSPDSAASPDSTSTAKPAPKDKAKGAAQTTRSTQCTLRVSVGFLIGGLATPIPYRRWTGQRLR